MADINHELIGAGKGCPEVVISFLNMILCGYDTRRGTSILLIFFAHAPCLEVMMTFLDPFMNMVFQQNPTNKSSASLLGKGPWRHFLELQKKSHIHVCRQLYWKCQLTWEDIFLIGVHSWLNGIFRCQLDFEVRSLGLQLAMEIHHDLGTVFFLHYSPSVGVLPSQINQFQIIWGCVAADIA